jgi:hypothetical protein
MNDTKQTSIGTLHFELVTKLLQGLEGEKSIAETLVGAEKICNKEVSEKIMLKARPQIMTLKEMYGQKKIKEDEARTEISNILIMLT